jgi:hypothetical protein
MKPALAVIAVLLLAQLVPYGRNQTNAPVVAEPEWDSATTRALAQRACFDCHSNQTTWPAYARIAPMSWLVQHDVESGRAALNFSEWQRPQEHAADAAGIVRQNGMPPMLYRLMHSGGRLSEEEREQLARGLERSVLKK